MKHIVTFGEVMLRLAAPGNLRFSQSQQLNSTFGGGEANVAVSLANFGLPAKFITRLPDNDIGRWCEQEIKKYGVNTSAIQWGGDRLGIYFLETGAVNRASKVIYDRAHSAIAEIKPGTIDWDSVFEDAQWFHFTGITPAISANAAEVCLEALQIASQKNLTISCDLNYRKKLWNWGKTPAEVMPDLVKECDIILGNEEDAEKIFGIKSNNIDVTKGMVNAGAFKSIATQLRERFPKVKKIVFTLRQSVSASHNNWSAVLFESEKMFVAPNYSITHIVDRVGGGDSFMAGFICGLLQNNDNQEALNFATAASALKHTIYGDFNLATVEEVEKLMAGDGSGRVLR
jgi:2-dehydro-3-deoxygluconokinase